LGTEIAAPTSVEKDIRGALCSVSLVSGIAKADRVEMCVVVVIAATPGRVRSDAYAVDEQDVGVFDLFRAIHRIIIHFEPSPRNQTPGSRSRQVGLGVRRCHVDDDNHDDEAYRPARTRPRQLSHLSIVPLRLLPRRDPWDFSSGGVLHAIIKR